MSRNIQLVKSQGAVIGVESFSGPDAFNGSVSPLSVVAEACQVIEPLLMIGEKRPTFGMDMRGQTIRGSRVEDGGITLDETMADIDAVRRHLGAEKIALLGYSPGGFFMLHYALRYPERVSALILAEPAIYTDTEDLIHRARLAEEGDAQRAMEAMLQYIDPSVTKAEKEKMAAEVVEDWQSAEIMGRVFRLHGEHQIHEKDLEPLKQVPTLLIGGSESPMNFHVRRIAAAVPSVTTWWVHGASHLDLLDGRFGEQVAEVVDQYLRSIQAQTEMHAPYVQRPTEDRIGSVQ